MKYGILVGFMLLGFSVYSQSIIGTWQLTEERTCFESNIKESDTEKELLADMKSSGNSSVARLIKFDKKGMGQDGIFSVGKKKGADMSEFKYSVNAQELLLLDPKSGIITQQLVIDQLSESTLKFTTEKTSVKQNIFKSEVMVTETEPKRDIRKLKLDELKNFFIQHGDKAFRAQQVYEWLWKKSAKDFEQMTNLSLATREILKSHFTINHVLVDTMQRSNDGTIKNAVKLHDGLIVESVLIPAEKRITACVSSQVGCSLACKFCATARLKRMRNLNPDEIYDQVAAIREQSELYFGRPLTNIVFMGMGEPLLNYANVIAAIDKITSPQGLNMAAKRITVSTVGIAKMIIKMADDEVKFNLAVSLHAAINETRSSIMPFNDTNSLEELGEALKYWYAKRKKKVTYEYVVWEGINDTMEHAQALLKFCKIIPSKVNLIEYNPIDDGEFRQASEDKLLMYQHLLESNGITARVRKSRGKDIDAACGQLANKG